MTLQKKDVYIVTELNGESGRIGGHRVIKLSVLRREIIQLKKLQLVSFLRVGQTPEAAKVINEHRNRCLQIIGELFPDEVLNE